MYECDHLLERPNVAATTERAAARLEGSVSHNPALLWNLCRNAAAMVLEAESAHGEDRETLETLEKLINPPFHRSARVGPVLVDNLADEAPESAGLVDWVEWAIETLNKLETSRCAALEALKPEIDDTEHDNDLARGCELAVKRIRELQDEVSRLEGIRELRDKASVKSFAAEIRSDLTADREVLGPPPPPPLVRR